MPVQALHEAVARVDDLLELKVILSVLRRLARQPAGAKWVTPRQLLLDPALALALSSVEAGQRSGLVAAALQRACERGILLCGRSPAPAGDGARYALNTLTSRRALEAAGWSVGQGSVGWTPEAATPPRTSIFDLYEQNIGLVTPLLAEDLGEAEKSYPAEWIEEAFREAVGYNKRNWRYIQRILENWATQGRAERGASGRYIEAARNRRRNLGARFRAGTGGG